jgi:hypothetical protein
MKYMVPVYPRMREEEQTKNYKVESEKGKATKSFHATKHLQEAITQARPWCHRAKHNKPFRSVNSISSLRWM